jgi:predicted DNA-binding transcriptional regulator AlpA
MEEKDRRIVSFSEAAKRAGVSPMTWVRIRRRGEAPPVVHISPHRKGHMLCDVDDWLEARKEPAR